MSKIPKQCQRALFARPELFESEGEAWQNAVGTDVIKYLGKISKKEFDYYDKLKTSVKQKNKIN